jgi:hypothetical protein
LSSFTANNHGMSESDSAIPDDPPPEIDADQNRLQCIGSFIAYTQEGEPRTIEIWTHFKAVHDRDLSRVEPGLLVLKTAEGDSVDRVDQGEYRLTESPEISMSTDDPNAP